MFANLPALKSETKSAEGRAETKNRDARWSSPEISGDGKIAVSIVRSADNKDRWFVKVDAESGAASVLLADHDDRWIRELFQGGLGFLADEHTLWFTSEKPGYMHLFTLDATASSPEVKTLTSGPWEIGGVDLSVDRKTFYLNTT